MQHSEQRGLLVQRKMIHGCHRPKTDWDAYHRVKWQSEDTLDPVARLAVKKRILRALRRIP